MIIGLEERIKQLVPEATRIIGQANGGGGGGGGGFGGGSTHRGNINILPRAAR